jgi:hypothetical protein
MKTTREDGPSLVEQSPRKKKRLSKTRKEEVERLARCQHSIEAGNEEDLLLSKLNILHHCTKMFCIDTVSPLYASRSRSFCFSMTLSRDNFCKRLLNNIPEPNTEIAFMAQPFQDEPCRPA